MKPFIHVPIRRADGRTVTKIYPARSVAGGPKGSPCYGFDPSPDQRAQGHDADLAACICGYIVCAKTGDCEGPPDIEPPAGWVKIATYPSPARGHYGIVYQHTSGAHVTRHIKPGSLDLFYSFPWMQGGEPHLCFDSAAREALARLPPEVPEGWSYGHDGAFDGVVGEMHTFKHNATGALVWCFSRWPDVWRWGYDPDGGPVTCHDGRAKSSCAEAMAAALAEAQPVLRPGWIAMSGEGFKHESGWLIWKDAIGVWCVWDDDHQLRRRCSLLEQAIRAVEDLIALESL